MNKKFNNKYIHLGFSKNPVAYCKLHEKTLSPTQMKSKQCLCKHCHHLIKFKSKNYWKCRNTSKNYKKIKKRKFYEQNYMTFEEKIEKIFSQSAI